MDVAHVVTMLAISLEIRNSVARWGEGRNDCKMDVDHVFWKLEPEDLGPGHGEMSCGTADMGAGDPSLPFREVHAYVGLGHGDFQSVNTCRACPRSD